MSIMCHSHTSQYLLYINSVHRLYNITALDQLLLSSQVVHSTQQVSWSSSSSMYIGIASTQNTTITSSAEYTLLSTYKPLYTLYTLFAAVHSCSPHST